MRKGRGEIIKLSTLFEKYKKILRAPQGTVIESFQDIVRELFKIDIPKSKIKYTVYSKTLSVAVRGPLKSEIQLHKQEIINHLKGRLGEQSAPSDIV